MKNLEEIINEELCSLASMPNVYTGTLEEICKCFEEYSSQLKMKVSFSHRQIVNDENGNEHIHDYIICKNILFDNTKYSSFISKDRVLTLGAYHCVKSIENII